MSDRSILGMLGGSAGALSLLAAVSAATALAAGPGLPRSYRVQRIDSPQPAAGANFSQGSANAGDLNGDGEDDLVTGQRARSPGDDGEVFVISGENGQLIDTIVAPDPGGQGNRANFAFPWVSRIGHNRGAPPFSDIGSCPGGTTGRLCPLPAIGPPDGVPDILVGARGVDVPTAGAPGGVAVDAGRAYVYDGRTRALLKRIDMPPAERTPLALSRAGGSWFGRVVLWPAGLPGCDGNFSVGSCPSGVPREVESGDLDGGGRPDIVVGASATTENGATANPASQCARGAATRCEAAGRAYVYRGEEIVGSNPAEVLDGSGAGETVKTIKSPLAQADNDQTSFPTASELFANSIAPVGDVGKCDTSQAPGIGPGDRCPRTASVNSPDGRPDVLLGALRVDYPIDDPDPGLPDVGASVLIDGATSSVLAVYEDPEPQTGALFGALAHEEPAPGDLGEGGGPDVFIPAPGQNTRATAGGRGYAMNGNFKIFPEIITIGRLDDPTPHVGENFGSSAAGVGDLVGGPADPANELLVGATGPFLGPTNRDLINDVHFFNAATERLLQTIPDPDQQPGSGFGESVVPLGDLNEDGFLDFAVGSWLYSGGTGIAEGRLYIFRSDNSQPGTAPAPAGSTPAVTRAGRSITLRASRRRVRGRGRVRLRGVIAAVTDAPGCESGQSVAIQRAPRGSRRFRTFKRVRSGRGGAFSLTLRPTRTYLYRAVLAQTARCLGAVSGSRRVGVVRRRR